MKTCRTCAWWVPVTTYTYAHAGRCMNENLKKYIFSMTGVLYICDGVPQDSGNICVAHSEKNEAAK